ncbi:MAG: ABC transporter substrate-binding protein [Alphaproteobacteria bacterium]|nr:ABC transporter substrate-binding protein [Alphaproteobacteria bacterium]
MSLTRTLYEKDLYPEIEEAHASAFGRDCMEIAADRLAKGEIDRRTFLLAATFLGLVPATLGSGSARAAAKELVIANWGGPARDAYANILGAPFEKATGIKVVIDGTGPLPSKVKAMVDSGAVVWDICDMDTAKTLVLAKQNAIEPIDYTIVDKAKLPPKGAYEYGSASYILSYVLTYNKQKVASAPSSWKDFWDVKKFPGTRTVRKQPDGMLESVMLAAGRAKNEVYPIDLKLVVAKIRELKANLIAWSSGSQSQEMFHQGEVVMGNLWHTRATILHRESAGRLTWTWNEALLSYSMWNVPRKNPAGREAAMRFLASAQDPQQQVDLLRAMGSGPVNPAAAALVPHDLKMFDPGQPAAVAVQVAHNPFWYEEPSGRGNLTNDALAREMWLDALSG